MSWECFMLNIGAPRSDRKRDAAIPLPEGVAECRNISYGSQGMDNLLDVYYPKGTAEPLPTIVSIHGGGYVYGTKEVYRRYCMDMARRGFSVVNFNYRLAPKWKFPTPLYDTNAVMEWLCANARRYHLDPRRVVLVGDSAGAQLASQYAAIATNPSYASLFPMTVPGIRIRAVGLYCGMYDSRALAGAPRKGIHRDYLGKVSELPGTDPRLAVLESVTSDYPPALVVTSHHDFLKDHAQPMADFLTGKGIACKSVCYGTPEDKSVAHVFHVNILTPEAVRCNDDSAEFFRRFL